MREIRDNDHLRTYFTAMGDTFKGSALERRLNLSYPAIRRWLSGKQGLTDENRKKVGDWARFFGYKEDQQYDSFL